MIKLVMFLMFVLITACSGGEIPTTIDNPEEPSKVVPVCPTGSPLASYHWRDTFTLQKLDSTLTKQDIYLTINAKDGSYSISNGFGKLLACGIMGEQTKTSGNTHIEIFDLTDMNIMDTEGDITPLVGCTAHYVFDDCQTNTPKVPKGQVQMTVVCGKVGDSLISSRWISF